MSENKLSMKFAYHNTDETRNFYIDEIESAALSGIKPAILAINTSLAASTDGGLAEFFISDDFNADQNVGKLKRITSATIESVEEVFIFGGKNNG